MAAAPEGTQAPPGAGPAWRPPAWRPPGWRDSRRRVRPGPRPARRDARRVGPAPEPRGAGGGRAAGVGGTPGAFPWRPAGRGRAARRISWSAAAPVEVKSWLSREERGGVPPGAQSVVNKLIQAEGQAAMVVLNGRGTGLSAAAAEAGLGCYAGQRHRAHIAAVRVLGDGFDLDWARQPSVRRDRDGGAAPGGPVREPGLGR